MHLDNKEGEIVYNRYIPQSDGTHRRRPTPEPPKPAPPPEPPCAEPPRPSKPHNPPQNHGGIGSFLRQILPSNFDVGDLIVVLLLLLMAADCQEDQNTALLTLALYLFL